MEFDTAQVFDWFSSKDGKLDLNQERARLAIKQREKIELNNQIQRGELIPIDEVMEKYGGMVVAFKNKMLALPTKLPPLISGAVDNMEIHDILKKHIYEALRELAEKI